MGVTVTKTFPDLATMPLTDRALMREIGLLARERIIRRTLAGTDQHDATFAPYSAGYAKQKAQALGSAAVNLQVSGAMLNAIILESLTENSVTLAFST